MVFIMALSADKVDERNAYIYTVNALDCDVVLILIFIRRLYHV
jgi:hypothetical protein